MLPSGICSGSKNNDFSFRALPQQLPIVSARVADFGDLAFVIALQMQTRRRGRQKFCQ